MPAAETVGTTRHDLLTEPYFAVLPPSHPLAGDAGPLRLKELAHEPWCVTQEEAFRDALELTWRSEGFQPRVVFESIFSRAIAGAAEGELGVGVIPGSTDLRGMNVVCRPIAETSLMRRVFALVRSGSEESPPVRAILDAMDAAAALAVESRVGLESPRP
jgi:DNA-binding transcriptional LysR family regulator